MAGSGLLSGEAGGAAGGCCQEHVVSMLMDISRYTDVDIYSPAAPYRVSKFTQTGGKTGRDLWCDIQAAPRTRAIVRDRPRLLFNHSDISNTSGPGHTGQCCPPVPDRLTDCTQELKGC
ncbi:hypothetical protein SKAU_G00149370 [Synaphobranchus kaupii]|uniref:Uncharacterized protein n=1 Tax=Synaphobranchus kaupii TaxID=118154 RepID=A0A9Q1FUH9_SYNKA|nr:hypothetical protein SKAU_G00149370 [Synaphobranchus kaupii]